MHDFLSGRWEDRDWRNVPGRFYGARTDNCWMGRTIAPDHIVYEDETGGEIVFRQPETDDQVRLVLEAARHDPYGAYAADGDEHWTLGLVRAWWADRARLAAWIADLHGRWSVSGRADERDNADGLRAYAHYLDGELAGDLRAYAFRLDNGRPPHPGERLPDL